MPRLVYSTDRDLAPRDEYRAHLIIRMIECGVPVHLHAGLREYFANRQPVGHFLNAILSNDLTQAALRADEVDHDRLPEIVQFLVNYAPAPAWGSPAKVARWLTETEPPTMLFE